MGTNGYTEDQFKQLVREMWDEQKLMCGLKRSRDNSSSEVPMIHSTSMWLLADSTTKDIPNDYQQSPSEQVKKRRRRGKRNHRSKPGPKSGQSGPAMVSSFFQYVS